MVTIKDTKMLNKVLKSISEKEEFVEKIKFKNNFLENKLFESLSISIEEFREKYYIIKDNLYIAESEQNYFIISTMGFVCYREFILKDLDKIYTSYQVQNEVLLCLINEATKLLKEEDVYDIDSYSNEKLSKISLAIFNNLLFYIELFGKCYLQFCGVNTIKEHKLKDIFEKVRNEMDKNNQNNTSFNFMIMNEIEKILDYISSIPGDFKEQYVKYNDNDNDSTIILIEQINQIENLINICNDFITHMKYDKNDHYYLKDGIYERLLEKCTTKEEKENVEKMYGHLIKNDKE